MKRKLNIIWAASILLGVTSCSDFLGHMPDDRTVIDSPDAVKELLVSAYPGGTYMPFAEAMSDNAQDKGPSAYDRDIAKNSSAYFWQEQSSTFQDTYTYFWNQSYAAISSSNHALEALDELGNFKNSEAYRAEAKITRAYNIFMLVNFFAENYGIQGQNENNLGVPYPTEPETEVLKEYHRETLQRTYELIEKDLTEALPHIQDNIHSAKSYHFTNNAAQAFASRFYLFKGEWDKVIEAADKVLIGNYPASFRPWNTIYNSMAYENIEKMFSESSQMSNLLLANVMSSYARNYYGVKYGMNTPIYQQIAATPFTGTQWAFRTYGGEVTYNQPKFKEYFKLESVNATTGYPYIMASLIIREEVLFNRVEAYIMQERYDDALKDLNAYLSTRITNYNASLHLLTHELIEAYYTDFKPELTPFYPINDKQRVYLNCVIDFKRKEFIQEGMRWFDVKRFHIEIERTPFEDPTTVIDKLTKDDLRRAVQIPQDALNFGVVPNPRNK